MNISKKNISKATQSALIYVAVVHLFPAMGTKRRFLLFVAINDSLAYLEDPTKYQEAWALIKAQAEMIKHQWKMADADYAFTQLKSVDLNPEEAR